MAPTLWLNAETKDNWIADKAAGFLWIGLSERYKAYGDRIAANDLLVTHVSGHGFAGVRRVVAPKGGALRGRVAYSQGCYPLCMSTELVVELPWSMPVKMGEIKNRLSFIPAGKKWGAVLLRPFRPLIEADAAIVMNAINDQLKLPIK